jgi:uncharacterized surface protein with fasciclin (FAS1) repeats
MKIKISNILKPLVVPALALFTLASCNKDLPEAEPITTPARTGDPLTAILNDPSYSLLRAAITRAAPATGSNLVPLSTLLADGGTDFTLFAPNDAAFQASGFANVAAINAQRTGLLDTLLRYHLVGGRYPSSAIPTTFPNIQLATNAVIVPVFNAQIPPGLRMSVFPSKRGNDLWVNNVPITQADMTYPNGIVHRIATLLSPPPGLLWNVIDTAADLTYLKAAIRRADEGTPAASTLEAALNNPGANLTVFAPSNAAFRALLTAQITQALMGPPSNLDQATAVTQATALASTPGVFTNAALASVLTPTAIRGLVVYHLLGVRAFTVNLPTTATNIPTLLNGAIPSHPGVSVQATFNAARFVTAATVRGAANPSASNIAISATPAPRGSSDQNYINGVLHKIDQVLRPQ